MVRSTRAVLCHHAAEFRHGQYHDIVLPAPQVLKKGRERARQPIGMTGKRPERPMLVRMGIPIRHCIIKPSDPHANISLDQLGHLAQALTDRIAERIVGFRPWRA